MRDNKPDDHSRKNVVIIKHILSTTSVKEMYGIRQENLYMDIATYPNLPASAEKCPLSNSLRMYVTVDSPVFAASVPLQIMCRS